MLIFPLKKEWYEKIKSGEKPVEYREVKPYWEKRIQKEIRKFGNSALIFFFEKQGDWIEFNNISLECKLREGYGSNYMSANITRIEIMNGLDTDLAIDKPVYAIHLADVREEEKVLLKEITEEEFEELDNTSKTYFSNGCIFDEETDNLVAFGWYEDALHEVGKYYKVVKL